MMPSLAMGMADGNPGLRKAIAQVFPGVRNQRCLVHKLRNILAKLPRLVARELKPLVKQVFEAQTTGSPSGGGGASWRGLYRALQLDNDSGHSI